MRLKKIKGMLSFLVVTAMYSTYTFITPVYADVTQNYNYAKAFQLSLYFYDANKCGQINGNDRLIYRSNCHLADAVVPLTPRNGGKGTNLSQAFISANKAVLDADGDGKLDLSGGYHDCGDHVKFGLPQAYSASTLGWGYYEFRNSYGKIGEQSHMEDILRWFNDYFMKCTFRDVNGNVIAFAYEVGDGDTDHGYWGAPELQTTDRPAWFATSETPASDQCAEAAASLAINYLSFKDTDLTYANKCLDTAKALYKFAKNNRGLGYGGIYYKSSNDEDDLSWAAVWLNSATGDSSYLNDVIATDSTGNYIGYMKKAIPNKTWKYHGTWVHSWDSVWNGVYARLAVITNDDTYWNEFRWNAEYWSGVQHQDNSSVYLAKTPGGYNCISKWGSARYNTSAQLCALIYNKYKLIPNLAEWAKSQMDYILGKNPLNRCYEVGYDTNSCKYPHHRASHGSTTNSMYDPVESKHTLWGALVGGPDESDYHKDARPEYVYNEVGVDYNAGFVGALAALYQLYGQDQKPLTDIPEVTRPLGVDKEAPTAPDNLICTAKASNSVSLSWNVASDNVAVIKYDIYEGSTFVGTSITTNFTVTGLSSSTSYCFTVKAQDAAGNISSSSNVLNITTNSESKVILGDINNDGKVDMLDYDQLQEYILSAQDTSINKQNTDINSDRRINTADLLALKKMM